MTSALTLLAAVQAGDRRSIGRAITVVETGGTEGAALEAGLALHAGRAHVVGITGPPGVGKSTLIHALLGELLRRGKRIAVVAVDPSSPVTGGAVLGDRVRMGEHGKSDRVFIRSVASRGHLGGASLHTTRIVDVLDAAGFDPILVETVGTGQSEVEIAGVADTRLVLCAPGLGDDIQAIKAGVLEIADVLVVNRADAPHADDTERSLHEMLSLRRGAAWAVRVLRTIATTGDGVGPLVDAIEAHRAFAGQGLRLRGEPLVAQGGRAAVERTLAAHRIHIQRFLPAPVQRNTVEAILAAARPARAVPPWRVHALAGRPLAELIAALRARGWSAPLPDAPDAPDAPLALVVTAVGSLSDDAWVDCGRFIDRTLAAARAHGLGAAVSRTSAETYHRIIEAELALVDDERAVAMLQLGYPDANGDTPSASAPAAAFARYLGFD